uniref:DUF3480 domain-containing protein n=1 Tax=Macrostomum lignano TaxID=282301 RepID=A0A1I8F4N0_9PLAT
DVNPHIVLTTRRRDSNSPGNWIEEQLEMCHGYSIGSLGTKSKLLIDGLCRHQLAGLEKRHDGKAGWTWDGTHCTLSFIISYEYDAAVTKKLALNTISRSALLPGAAVPLPEQWAAGLPEHFGQQHEAGGAQLARTPESRAAAASDCKWNIPTSTEMRQAMDRESNSWLVRLELSNFDFSCPCHDCDAPVLYMALTADLPDIQISYSAIETGINVSVTFIDCNRNASSDSAAWPGLRSGVPKQFMLSGRTPGGLVFLAIVLTLLLLGCLLFINQRPLAAEFTARSKIRPTSAHRSGEEMSRTPATGSHRLVGKSRRLVRQRDIEQSPAALDEERLARPLTRQRGEEAEVADVDFVLQEAPQRIVVRWSAAARRRSGPTAPTASAGWAKTDLLLLLEHIAIDNAAPADPVALFAGEGSTVGDMDHTVFQASERGFLGSQYTGGVLYFLESGQCFHGLVHRPTLAACWPCRLVHRRELPYLLHSPTRLLLRLGAEDGVYPCGLISNATGRQCSTNRPRSEAVPHLSEGLVPRLRDCNLTLESNGIVVVSISGRRQADLASLLSVYAPDTDGVLALAGELCQSADAHLVARESPGGEFETVLFSAAGRPQIWPAGDCRPRLGCLLGRLQSLASALWHCPLDWGQRINRAAWRPSWKTVLALSAAGRTCGAYCRSLNEAEDFVLPLDWLFLHDRREPMRSSSIRFVWRHLPGE